MFKFLNKNYARINFILIVEAIFKLLSHFYQTDCFHQVGDHSVMNRCVMFQKFQVVYLCMAVDT